MNGLILFIVLPYLALTSAVLGSVYRYLYHGFHVSSYSSQLLESNILYFGSRPFHWGIITLFFGHLIAFMIPRAVLAWNAIPLRLYILAITAFAFGITAFTGLGILIYRRLQVSRIRRVTTAMDIFVFVVLSVQVITGLWVAFFFRWGSTWFTQVLTPYLRSLLILKPDTAVIIALPFMIKMHVVSAFILIGSIPFTRFMHFLVYPFVYLWRAYQQVIWNKAPRKINADSAP